jgi:hypothetical protein
MLKSEIKPGTDYAVREKRVRGFPFQRVRIVEHVRGNKWKAKWIDPNAGLVDYIGSGQLIVPWREHKAFLKEEASEDRLREHNAPRLQRQEFARDHGFGASIRERGRRN